MTAIVALGMGIIYGKLLFCHEIAYQSTCKKIPIIEYNDRTVYELFYNPFPVYGVIPDFNIPPITIDDIPLPNKRSQYTPDTLPAAISVTSVNYVSMLTTPSDSTQVVVLNYD